MKIKDLLQALIHNVEDHHWESTDKLAHGEECEACQAVRMAQELIDSIALRDVFDPGHKVAIGDVPGIVEDVEIVYMVRFTDVNGNRQYGRFASEYVSSPLLRYFSDHAGDIWRAVNAAGDMLILDEANGVAVSSKGQAEFTRDWVEQTYGPLVPVKR